MTLSIEQRLDQALADITKHEAQYEAQASDLKAAQERAAELEAAVASLTTQINETQAERDTALANKDAEIDRLNEELARKNDAVAELQARVSDIEADDRDFEKSVSQRAAEIAAQSGVSKPVQVSPDGGPEAATLGKNRQELWAQCAAIEDPAAQRAFYERHLKETS